MKSSKRVRVTTYQDETYEVQVCRVSVAKIKKMSASRRARGIGDLVPEHMVIAYEKAQNELDIARERITSYIWQHKAKPFKG